MSWSYSLPPISIVFSWMPWPVTGGLDAVCAPIIPSMIGTSGAGQWLSGADEDDIWVPKLILPELILFVKPIC